MKKLVGALLAGTLTVLLACMSGCSMMTAFEKDINVVLNVNGVYSGSYTVNIFNNTVVPEPTKPGFDFLGWSLKPDYQPGTDSEDLLLPEKGLIRYDDVKDAVEKNSATVNVYAVFGEKPKYDFVIGWYAKTGTTGLTQTMMDNFTTALYSFLTENGYTPDSMLIDIREYASELGVADVGTAVNEEGDVDIIIGMGNNITSTGGIETLEREDDYAIGGKSRNIARLTDDPLAVLVFEWMKTDSVRAIFA